MIKEADAVTRAASSAGDKLSLTTASAVTMAEARITLWRVKERKKKKTRKRKERM